MIRKYHNHKPQRTPWHREDKPFLSQYAEKCSAGKWYIDGWIQLQKRDKILFTYTVQCINTKKALVRDLNAADVRYHLDCWLGVTKIQACWSGAIATTISSILVKVQQTAQIVGYCYNKYVCWSGASVSDMHACRSKLNRHDCWLGATVKGMANGLMQLLQTWLMVRCKCNIHKC